MPRFALTRKEILGIAAALCLGLVVGLLVVDQVWAAGKPGPKVERGRYIAIIGGCNDCHTPRYAEAEGKVPESDWLVGDVLGWRGAWGTTYPTNLRNLLTGMSEKEWVEHARTLKTMPPMPWFNVQVMKVDDLRAFHAFVKHLGPAGPEAPRSLSPNEEPTGPCIVFPAPPEAAPAVPRQTPEGPATRRSG